jgi:hypothetical protein
VHKMFCLMAVEQGIIDSLTKLVANKYFKGE